MCFKGRYCREHRATVKSHFCILLLSFSTLSCDHLTIDQVVPNTTAVITCMLSLLTYSQASRAPVKVRKRKRALSSLFRRCRSMRLLRALYIVAWCMLALCTSSHVHSEGGDYKEAMAASQTVGIADEEPTAVVMSSKYHQSLVCSESTVSRISTFSYHDLVAFTISSFSLTGPH